MILSSTIDSRRRITIPHVIRQRLGLKAGDRVDFALVAGQATISPNLSENSFEKYVGVLPEFASKRELNLWLRRLRAER